ncbi:MAG: CDP-alcohol phosphatidyltransferase family protein [Candidatus Hodarchaeales archaeon]|jgi:phosphatidylserine synthase
MKGIINRIYKEQPGEHIYKPHEPYERLPVIKLGLIFSMPILRLLQKINIRFHPSILSAFGLLFNILAGLFFGIGYLKLGSLSFFIALIFDLLDGPWARLTNQMSSFAIRFDHFCDRIGKIACFVGLWYNQYYLTDTAFLGLGLIAIYYLNEAYATKFLTYRFKNLRNMSITVWEITFMIFVIGPILNMVNVFLPFAIILLFLIYLYMTITKGVNKDG